MMGHSVFPTATSVIIPHTVKMEVMKYSVVWIFISWTSSFMHRILTMYYRILAMYYTMYYRILTIHCRILAMSCSEYWPCTAELLTMYCKILVMYDRILAMYCRILQNTGYVLKSISVWIGLNTSFSQKRK